MKRFLLRLLRPYVDVLLLDAPYIVDSLTRHADYRLNRLYRPDLSGGVPRRRSPLGRPPFVLLLVVLFFTAYGPTYNSLCGLGYPPAVVWGTKVLGAGLVVAAIALCLWSFGLALFAINRRFRKMRIRRSGARYAFVRLTFFALAVVYSVPLGYLGYSMTGDMPGGCHAHANHWPAIIQLVLLAVAVALVWNVLRQDPSIRKRLFYQALAMWLLVAMTFLASDGTSSEAAQVPYPHVFGVVAASLATIACLSTFLVNLPFESVTRRERLAANSTLRRVELFAPPRRDPELSWRRVLGGFVTNLLAKPLHFLILPAFAVLLAPAEHVWGFCIGAAIASGLLLTAGSLTSRWDRMLQYLKRYFLLGTPFAVSAAVIVVAALRLGGVQYATTLLNVAPFGVLFLWMVMAYALCWWFEYEANSILAARVLQIFSGKAGREDALVRYRLCDGARDQTPVCLEGRFLTGHGMGELILVGRVEASVIQYTPAYEADGLKDFFRKLLGRAKPDQAGRRKARATRFAPAFEAYSFIDLIQKLMGIRRQEQAHELIRRAQLYFSLVNLLIVIAFGVLAWNWGRGDRLNTVEAVITTHQPPSPEDMPADLEKLLEQDPDNPKPSAIVVSASGGGTRAALYTAITLQGLHKLHADDRVVLLSGVSGGAVASAYFYGHRDALVHDRKTSCIEGRPAEPAWDCYMDRMTMPFIDDVLRGASEWRIQSDQPLGVLLAESFERRLFQGDSMTLASRSDVGLILNTTVTGHPLEDAPALDGTLERPPGRPSDDCEWPVSALGGSRLSFSNLAAVESFSKYEAQAPAISLPFLVLRDRDIELAKAAALSANFPPVFPNARVNVTGFEAVGKSCRKRSYFVTDGGAVENLSLISALLAIDSALIHLKPGTPVRTIDIVLAEGSALQFDYAQDRGIGAVTDQAKERLTGRLTLELLEHLRSKQVTINIHDVSLPRVFRSRGGFGTHWEFPASIRIEDPLVPAPTSDGQRLAGYLGGGRESLSLDRDQLIELWTALYNDSKDKGFCDIDFGDAPSGDLTRTKGWICGLEPSGWPPVRRDPQIDRWAALKAALAPSSPSAAGTPSHPSQPSRGP